MAIYTSGCMLCLLTQAQPLDRAYTCPAMNDGRIRICTYICMTQGNVRRLMGRLQQDSAIMTSRLLTRIALLGSMHDFQTIGYQSSRVSFKEHRIRCQQQYPKFHFCFRTVPFTRGSMFLLYSLVYFGASFAALILPDNVLRQPLNFSTTAIAPGNHTLGGWPPEGAWTPLGGDLSFTFDWYGSYLSPNKWNDIRVAFDDIKNRVEGYPDWSTSRKMVFRSGYVLAEFCDFEEGKVSAVEAAKVVKAIKDFIFIFGYKPREMQISICKARREMMELLILFKDNPSPHWPKHLPFDEYVRIDQKISIYLYGRDAEPSSNDRIHATLDELERHFKWIHTTKKEMKHYTYSNRYLKLIVEGAVSGDTKDRMTQGLLIETIIHIRHLYFFKGFGPRELSMRYLVLHGQVWREVGKVFIHFTDLDSTDRAIE